MIVGMRKSVINMRIAVSEGDILAAREGTVSITNGRREVTTEGMKIKSHHIIMAGVDQRRNLLRVTHRILLQSMTKLGTTSEKLVTPSMVDVRFPALKLFFYSNRF